MPTTHSRRCTECQCSRPLTTEHWFLRSKSDPTGLAYRSIERFRTSKLVQGPIPHRFVAARKAGRKGRWTTVGTDYHIALISKLNTKSPNAPLWVQSRCRTCDRLRRRRVDVAKTVVKSLAEGHNVVAALKCAETRIVTNELPSGWLDEPVEGVESRAEWLAANAIVATRVDGSVHMPKDPVKALRAAYRLLIPVDPTGETVGDKGKTTRAGRLGALDSDRLQMLAHVTELAAEPGIPKKLMKQVQWVEAIARLHAGGDDANAVAPKLLKTMRRYHYKYAQVKYSNGFMSKEEAEGRLDAGNLIGLLKWSPLHKSGAMPGTVAGWWAARELQIRSRADRAIGVYEIEKGVWSKPAAFLGAISMGGEGDEGGFTPNMQTLGRDTVVGGGQRRNGATVDGGTISEGDTLSVDVQSALAALSALEREVLLSVADGVKLSRLSEALGITVGEAKTCLAAARKTMQELLVSYSDQADDEIEVAKPEPEKAPEQPVVATSVFVNTNRTIYSVDSVCTLY